MSAPAALAMSKIFYPETAKPETTGKIEMEVKSNYTNALDAITTGALDGLKLALNVGAMLIAFLGLLALVNGAFGLDRRAIGLVWAIFGMDFVLFDVSFCLVDGHTSG